MDTQVLLAVSRLHEITQLFLNPPRAPTPEEEALEEQTHEDVAQQAESIVAAVGLPSTLGTTGAFHFMQEDELESTPAEPIVEPQYDAIPKVEQPAEVEVVDTVIEDKEVGQTVVQETTVTIEVCAKTLTYACNRLTIATSGARCSCSCRQCD